MEVQVNVAQDQGERVEGEFKGRQWHAWSDGLTTWKSFRVPYKASTEPEYEDRPMTYDLAEHAEGIGMTGWDWVNRQSKWVAFDFDAIVGHSDKHTQKLTDAELSGVRDAAMGIDWVTVRRSTSGKGLHLYVMLDPPVPTRNHNEHAALARSILGTMSALTGFNFFAKVDICGGNFWVWHRKMRGTDGLKIIKQGSPLSDVPVNWRDHVEVVSGRKRKLRPSFLPSDIGELAKNPDELFDELTGQSNRIPLDEEHRKHIDWLKENNATWWWDADNHMLVTHTTHLKTLHTSLGLRGLFETDSSKSSEQNCFLFALRKGAWVVRRYTPGVKEHPSWSQDSRGWTRCYFNKSPDLNSASRALSGVENTKGGFVFTEGALAVKAAQALGVYFDIPAWAQSRKTVLKEHKDGRLVVEVERADQDNPKSMEGWLNEKSKWVKIFTQKVENNREHEIENCDDLLRHLVTNSGDDCGWVLNGNGKWRSEPLAHVKPVLTSLGHDGAEVQSIIGNSTLQCWTLVNHPFQDEYPGDRQWNKGAAQLRYKPSEDYENLSYPTWTKILKHCGAGLDSAILQNPWARANGITTGADYLKIWIASLFKEPEQPLPYLFLFSEKQDNGKSSLHEALSLLITDNGWQRADNALTSQQGFNGELANAVLCVVEETDMQRNKVAYNRIKDWVTSKHFPVHIKGETPYKIPNTTHWIQTANKPEACPVFPGDTRITVIHIPQLDPTQMIPKKKLTSLLEKEAPDFLAEVLRLEIPPSNDRLNVPVIRTAEKSQLENKNLSLLERFIQEYCHYCVGAMMKYSDFYDKFRECLDPTDVQMWSKVRVGKELPVHFPKGRNTKDCQFYIGNITFDATEEPKAKKIITRGDGNNTMLVEES